MYIAQNHPPQQQQKNEKERATNNNNKKKKMCIEKFDIVWTYTTYTAASTHKHKCRKQCEKGLNISP